MFASPVLPTLPTRGLPSWQTAEPMTYPIVMRSPERALQRHALLRAAGIAKSRLASVPLAVDRVMAGGQELEFLQHVYAGDTLTVETRFVDLIEKRAL